LNGASTLLTADLGGGNDKAEVDLSLPAVAIDAASEAHFDLIGGPGNDALTVTRNGTVATAGTKNGGLLDVRLSGGDGNDTESVDLGGGGFGDSGTIRVRANGDAGADVMTVVVEPGPLTAAVTTFDVWLNGGPGNDTLAASLASAAGAFDLGPAGRIILDGSFGSDRCTDSGGGAFKPRNCEL
jgi:hypothetical protein